MKAKIVTFIIIAIIAVMSIACSDKTKFEKDSLAKSVNKEEISELSILCVGDIMAHKPQYESAYDSESGSYSFDANYNYVRNYISEADLALCNVETVFADKEPCGYPLFNSPVELADAIKNAGFDVAITSNNHMLDQGTAGVERTIQVLNNAGLATVGSRLTEEENRYIIKKVDGIKVGIVAYTYETTGQSSTPSINGNAVPSEIVNRICSFNPDNWQTDITEIKENVSAARTAGADLVVCYFHWGEEYKSQPLEYQVNMANEMIADAGADVIFASHPHVLEPVTVVTNNTGKKVPVYYSMGNFISNQRTETLGANRRNTEDGMIAEVKFNVTTCEGKVTDIELAQASALPTWVNRYKSENKWAYDIVPLDKNYENNKSLIVSGNTERAKKSIVDSLDLLGTDHNRDAEGRIIIYDIKDSEDNVSESDM